MRVALREALAQPEPEPVAWMRNNGFRYNGDIEPTDDSEVPLYLVPPAPEVPAGWKLVNLNMTPEQRCLMLRADEFTAGEMWVMLLAAAPEYKETLK